MNFYDALDTTFGGVLPGGPAPGDVAYRDTFLAPITGGALAIAATPVALIGGGINALVTGGEINPLTTWAGAYNLGSGSGAGSIGDGPFRVSPGYTGGDFVNDWKGALFPDLVYTAPSNDEQREPGTQEGESPLADKLKEIGKGVLVAMLAALGLAAISAGGKS